MNTYTRSKQPDIYKHAGYFKKRFLMIIFLQSVMELFLVWIMLKLKGIVNRMG